jgi:hypothetical protein
MASKTRTKVDRKKTDESMDDSFPLAEEVRTYESHLPGWLDREAQWVLIKGREVLGFFPSFEEALRAGYRQIEDGPFLVKQISQFEPIYNLGNVDL